MQRKAILCIIGILLLFLIGLAGVSEKKKIEEWEPAEEKEEPHQPVVEIFTNVYLTDLTNTYLSFFDGEEKTYPLAENKVLKDTALGLEGSLVDITVTDGAITGADIRGSEKVSGKVLGVESGKGVELEGFGFLPFSEDVRFFMLYGGLRLGTEQDIRIGYQFADFVLEDGRICGVLLTADETMEYIRVLIKTSDYAGNYHEAAALSCDVDYVLLYERDGVVSEEAYRAGESITVTPESIYFAEGSTGRIQIIPSALTGKISLLSVTRSQGTPAYRGTLEISCVDGRLIIINELLLEEYLYAVVPSEMPSSYPIEALKAQAICARTYAYARMLRPGLPGLGAHVDDSTGYQVYNNILEQNSTTTAVRETTGQLLYASDGSLVDAYYYSTSCGFGSDEHVWKSESAPELPYLSACSISEAGMTGAALLYTAESMTEESVFASFLKEPPESDFEREEPWYRWSYEVKNLNTDRMLEMLQSRYTVNNRLVLTLQDGEYVSVPIEKLGSIKAITVLMRNAGGVADELLIESSTGTYKVISELNIRYVLCDGKTKVCRQDGSEVAMASLLPSAFFIITPVYEGENMKGYQLLGGGFGHGAGMSQNGARAMASSGYSAEEILGFFYRDSTVRRIGQ